MAFNSTFTFALPAAVTNGIAQTQTPLAGGNLTINGSLSSGGVANLVTAQRVGIHSAADDTARTFTVYGTDRYSRPQIEAVTGVNNGTAQTTHDFLTVTRISVDAATAGAVFAGTVGVGSSIPIVLDTWVNPSRSSIVTTTTGTVNYSVQVSADDLSPSWDVNANTPYWFVPPEYSGSPQITGDYVANVLGPYTMFSILINSGTGTVKTRLNMPFLGGAF